MELDSDSEDKLSLQAEGGNGASKGFIVAQNDNDFPDSDNHEEEQSVTKMQVPQSHGILMSENDKDFADEDEEGEEEDYRDDRQINNTTDREQHIDLAMVGGGTF